MNTDKRREALMKRLRADVEKRCSQMDEVKC